MADADKAIGSNWRIFLVCAVLLVLNCLWRVLTPAHEFGSSTSGDGRRGVMVLASWPGLVAGIAIFGIRFSSDHGWSTGHMRYVLK